ncbi:DUF4429 domain-containing protein [Streptomyces sp. DSM 44915]|uniref:DUF4429 domain-containing protein n=1 Tax=Streptomyces chisholmiae TaxID=3075540 RepID=A0ABU2JPE8_9ACTN|nr:DUF4429 domain-containing protein [Streptomyces sp. DSM 44915]MDT0266782.1 DUF4429 domain-containing protein [Streptomyces sp. DSM 44915]
MGDVLAGIHSTWEFDTDSVLIRFERGIRTPKLFQVLGERRIPYEALSSVELAPGARKGTVVLHAVPRAGADPLVEAAAGQLRQAADPYRLVLPAERESLAAYHAGELRAALGPAAGQDADRYLVAAPVAPLQFKAYDGKVSFDSKVVSFRWFWTGASSAKWKAGDQTFPVSELAHVEWRSPEIAGGHLRLLRRGADGQPEPEQDPVDQDPAAVVFGPGYGLVHESLPLAAAVLEAIHAAEPEGAGPRDGVAGKRRADPADIADRIRHLGDLRDSGLVTDEEFTAKKRELLAEL